MHNMSGNVGKGSSGASWPEETSDTHKDPMNKEDNHFGAEGQI